jgi:AcrR family transcriptional regulator
MRLPADQRRRQLLDVARVAFARNGFHATSMDEVAVQAGVTKPVLYQHFPSKRALYVELLRDTGARLLGRLEETTARATTGRARVEEGFAAYFRFVFADEAAFRLLFAAPVRSDPEFAREVEGTLRAAADTVADLIDLEVPTEQRRVLARSLVGMAEAVSRRALTDPDAEREPERLARWVAEMAWFGLRGVRADDAVPAAGAPPAARP